VICHLVALFKPIADCGWGQSDAARPSYPAKALQTVASALPKAQGEGLIILEPGSGTGIFSRLLLNPPSSDSAQGSDEYPQIPIKTLIGVEPSEGMRETWQRVLESKVPKEALEGKTIKSVEGAFDDFSKSGVQEGSVDGIIIAQAWHWCPDHDKAFVSRFCSFSLIHICIKISCRLTKGIDGDCQIPQTRRSPDFRVEHRVQ
jgi:hypothetical protein